MLTVLNAENWLMIVIDLVLLAVKIFAFVNSLTFPAEAYNAANKLTKPAWTIILGVGVAVHLVMGGPIGFLNIAFTIAAFVYLADVRPALSGLRRR